MDIRIWSARTRGSFSTERKAISRQRSRQNTLCLITMFPRHSANMWGSRTGFCWSPRLFGSPRETRSRESRGRTSPGCPSWRETAPSSSPARPSGAVRPAAAWPWNPSTSPSLSPFRQPCRPARSARKQTNKKARAVQQHVVVGFILFILLLLFCCCC